MFENLKDKIFGQGSNIIAINKQNVMEDTYENTPMFDIEKRANQLQLWPNHLPIWRKFLVLLYMASTFHIQVVSSKFN